MNLGEVATGLAMVAAMPDGARGIITHLGMDYLKKARGPIIAECTCAAVNSTERKEYDVVADLQERGGRGGVAHHRPVDGRPGVSNRLPRAAGTRNSSGCR